MEQTKTHRKRRKYSKKSKKNLRKYTDIRDVEEFLEEQRFQERTGGLVAEKKDEQLFYVQNEASDDVQKTSKSLRRKRLLRSQAHLFPDPVISGFPQSSNTIRVSSESTARYIKAKNLLGEVSDSSEDEREYDVSSRFSVKRRREEAELSSAVCKRLNKSKLKPVARDPWADDVGTLARNDVPDEHFLRVTRKFPVKKPATVGGRPSALASIVLPPPGSSYNPAFDDHQELLRSAVDVEETRLAADQKINKRLEPMEPMTASEREQVWQDEMIEGLIEGEGKEEEEKEEKEEGLRPNKRPILAADRKTSQQRRKEAERKMKEKQRLAMKTLKRRMNDMNRLRSLKRMIERRERAAMEKVRQRWETTEDEQLHTKRLGRMSYVDPDIDVQLSSEISGALRTLKCEGNIARDRYKSLQKRNIIEPRQRVRPHRKYRLKIKEKRSARLPEKLGANI